MPAGRSNPVSLLVRADTCLNPQDAAALGAVETAVVQAVPGVADAIGNTAVTAGKSLLTLCWEASERHLVPAAQDTHATSLLLQGKTLPMVLMWSTMQWLMPLIQVRHDPLLC